MIVPVDGGAPRVLWRLGEGEWINNTSIPWTPDGRAVIVRRMLDARAMKSDLWLVPIDGGARRKLDVDVSRIATFANGRISVHPDGRQLAYLSNDERRYQVMVVDNILTAQSSRRQ